MLFCFPLEFEFYCFIVISLLRLLSNTSMGCWVCPAYYVEIMLLIYEKNCVHEILKGHVGCTF